MKNMKKRSLRRIFAGILGIGILLTGAAPCAAAAYGYDEYGDPIVTATPVPDGQAAAVTPAHSSYYSQAADTDSIDGWPKGQRPALMHKQVTHAYYALDVAKMMQAAQKFEGTHNFESFRAAACQSNQPVRHVSHCRLIQHGSYLVLDIQADGFLHHMVRNIMGCLLEIGQGMYEVKHIEAIFAAEDRKAAGITAPPDGLYFIHADYPAQFELPKQPLGPHWLNMPE